MSREDISLIVEQLRELSEKLDAHIKSSTAFQTEAQPLLDALRFVQTIQKFTKWAGISLIACIGFVYWIIRRI